MIRLVLLTSLILLALVQASMANDKSVNRHISSPYAQLQRIDIGEAKWTTGFWADKYKLTEQAVVPHMGSLLKGDIGHAFNNFKIAAGLKDGVHQGMHWHDGDFYKWMESLIYVYAINGDQNILAELDEVIQVIAQAQLANGYLSTSNQVRGIKPWTKRNHHELYNSGHLITTAVVHKRVTGQNELLDVAIKHANYLYDLFMPTPDHLKRFGFNMSQIIGLVDLYRETGDKRYLVLANHFTLMRAPQDTDKFMPADDTVFYIHQGDMVQERTPLREETEAVGHAVLGMHLWSGAADIYAETGEAAIIDALKRIWGSAINRKMFVHGGLGQIDKAASEHYDLIHEGFYYDYLLPNSRAYAETCANVSNAMFSFRMLGLLGESKYADVMELVLYNGALSGLSLDGKHYFYTNPTRKVNGVHDYHQLKNESAIRQPYIACFCCPPNLARTLAKLSNWAYSKSANGITVNIYGGNTLDTTLLDGSRLKLTQTTNYPWQGQITIQIEQAKSQAFDVQLRIPAWAQTASIAVNGQKVNTEILPGQFSQLTRQWAKGDVITLDIPMDITYLEGHPLIEEIRNEVAVKRGPIVYALESVDLPTGVDILDVYIAPNHEFIPEYKPNFLGGVTTLQGSVLLRSDKSQGLYRAVSQPRLTPYNTQLIPYFAWSNRGDEDNEMTVFMPAVWQYEQVVQTPNHIKGKDKQWSW
ncbi:hypothetical protein C2869_00660 [Saccharobesus litoralis]|uniref:Glycoside hydrolase family 127 protein n=1 Tax=Saccharobesus litoralis TaxID=2172099 RepID=A0A2S0VLF6_9ALTE|nr:beta-L-arabinofuranosidase domain-containing protein [Saccharobesus litoralis]AWB65042.1 hypothetical protein C2869_00660 [Saccharobesus litoralis]